MAGSKWLDDGRTIGWRRWGAPEPHPLAVSKRVVLCGAGAVPVSLIGLATFGFADLKLLAVTVATPALAALAVVLVGDASARALVARALPAGLVATFLYDLFRWSFLAAGWMARDPIPHIGHSLDLAPGWLFGYLWRFIGNGGGLAVTFYAAGRTGVLAGTGYGLAVCGGLLGVLLLAPHGQEVLFPLVPSTLVVAVVGHLIYGSSLGWMSGEAGPLSLRRPRPGPPPRPRREGASCERSGPARR